MNGESPGARSEAPPRGPRADRTPTCPTGLDAADERMSHSPQPKGKLKTDVQHMKAVDLKATFADLKL